jgi:beta-galactosidase
MYRLFRSRQLRITFLAAALLAGCGPADTPADPAASVGEVRQRVLLDTGWRFLKVGSPQTDGLSYESLEAWILPTANRFLPASGRRHAPPDGAPATPQFAQPGFDDSRWHPVSIPHDWAIAGPFFSGEEPEVGGGMGRLPSPGVGWYRKRLDIDATAAGRSIFLDIDGAMSYAAVWLNGELVGGWPYGYASWRVDLTPHVEPGGDNVLAIRLENPPDSSRWYPGGGLYRNVWLTISDPVHIAQWGTRIRTSDVSAAAAVIEVTTDIDNDSSGPVDVTAATDIFALDSAGRRSPQRVARIDTEVTTIEPGDSARMAGDVTLLNPALWGPPPVQSPHLYVAITQIVHDDVVIDRQATQFGIRDVEFDPDRGVFVNGEHVYLKGVNQHHDLGALGAAFNVRAAERQLEILRDMGVNAIRTAHNPPAPELLELTDRMGFLVIDEIFDVWRKHKTPQDFSRIFDDWHEADLRAFIRRDRNHPSVILWSVGNELGEQYDGEEGAAVGRQLHDIARDEDPTRPTTAAFNYAKPDMPLPAVFDVVSLNYQGEGIRDAGPYEGLPGISTPPLYPAFHEAFPDKLVLSSENAAAVSSRGEYLFPVTSANSAPVMDGAGGDPVTAHVSAYELYTAPFGSSADKVFAVQAANPFVAGGFIWSGWDYLGEPTPYYSARSSYFGVIDLAGFPKDRFYLYQSQWRPDHPMVHVLPHWNWPDRIGEITPVHVFTSGDEAELFLDGE